MICQSCKDGRETECWGLTKDKTWCDSQHYPKDTVILQAQFCKHLRATNNYCPTCGMVFDDTQDRDGGNTTEQPMDVPAETQRDIEDNFITNPDDTVEEAREDVRKAKRSIIPKRNKETPSS